MEYIDGNVPTCSKVHIGQIGRTFKHHNNEHFRSSKYIKENKFNIYSSHFLEENHKLDIEFKMYERKVKISNIVKYYEMKN